MTSSAQRGFTEAEYLKLELVRHGKASPTGTDYDVLSELGVRQSVALGQRFGRHGVAYDRVFTGTLARHTETLRAMLDTVRGHGVSWPHAVELAELDEAPLVRLIKGALMERLGSDAELQRLVTEMSTPDALAKGDARLRPVLGYMAQLWVQGEIALDGVETYAVFAARIRRALEAIVAAARSNERVLVVSSVGAISELVHQALDDDGAAALSRLDRIPNASITELFLDGAGYRLGRLGDVEHLEPAELVTYL